jgi:hypothetical protein
MCHVPREDLKYIKKMQIYACVKNLQINIVVKYQNLFIPMI